MRTSVVLSLRARGLEGVGERRWVNPLVSSRTILTWLHSTYQLTTLGYILSVLKIQLKICILLYGYKRLYYSILYTRFMLPRTGPKRRDRGWEHTSTCKSSGGRSSQISSDFSFVCGAGSIDSWQPFTEPPAPRDQTKLVASATRPSRGMWSTGCVFAVVGERGRFTKVTRWESPPTRVSLNSSSRGVCAQWLRWVQSRINFSCLCILFCSIYCPPHTCTKISF